MGMPDTVYLCLLCDDEGCHSEFEAELPLDSLDLQVDLMERAVEHGWVDIGDVSRWHILCPCCQDRMRKRKE